MVSADGQYVIILNGEIYNFGDLRGELEGTGSLFRGRSDTEVLLEAMARWGCREAVARAVGMFAFALWDRRQRILHLGRDRLGEKPLYYGEFGDTQLYGSEPKSLSAHPAWQGDIDRNALALLLRCGYVPAPFSIYRNVRKLMPGHVLSFRRDGESLRWEDHAYWSLRDVAERGVAHPFTGAEEEAADRLEELLKDATKRQMIADVPLGAFLSGGIDSSTIVSLMQEQSARPVRTFTIGFHEDAYDEARHAAKVARHLGTEHTELHVDAGHAREMIPRMPAIYDEPFGDSSQIPTCLVAQMTRKHVTVALSGDAGDELFGGYPHYFRGVALSSVRRSLPHSVRSAMAALVGAAVPLSGRRARQVRWLADSLRVPDMRAVGRVLTSYWSEPAAVVPGAEEPETVHTDPARGTSFDQDVRAMMYCDAAQYLPDDILVKVDRAAMAVSLETRIPLLDHRVVEFAWSLPVSMKIVNGSGKQLLRRLLARRVPPALTERPKQGFSLPVGEWLRTSLRDWAESLLDANRLAQEGWLRPGPIRRQWEEHLSGRSDGQRALWHVLMFQAWLEAQK